METKLSCEEMEFPKGKDAKYFWIFIGILGIIMIIIFGMNISNNRKIMTIHSNLKETEISGIVYSISTDRFMTILKVKDKRNEPYYFWNYKNSENESSYLKNFIKSNDSIHKAENSLIVEVIKKDKTYYFEIE